MGTLSSGQNIAITDWRNTGSNLVIKVNEIDIMSSPGWADISITFGGPVPPAPGFGSSLMDWLASLPPGVALAVIFAGTLVLFVLICLCCYSSTKRRNIYFVDESFEPELFNQKRLTNLSYVGENVQATLLQHHHRQHQIMWNVTSGKLVSIVFASITCTLYFI